MLRPFKWICLILIFGNMPLAHADGIHENRIASLFNDATKKHRGKFERLMRTRRLLVKPKSATLDKVLERLSHFTEPTTLILYDHHLGSLRIWALNTNGEVRLKKIDISKKEIQEILYGFRKSINTAACQIERAARPKRGHVLYTNEVTRRTGIQEVSQLLLPIEFSELIENSQHLLIVPALSIGAIPFCALTTPGQKGQLVDHVSITVLPSLFDIDDALPDDTRFISDRSEMTASALIVGNPEFFNDPDWHFPQLPGAESG